MTIVETETCLDLMPSIPLARGVPVVYRDGARGIVFETTNGGTMAIVHYAYPVTTAVDGSPFTQAVTDLRVDIEDSQGFGYTLRWGITTYTTDFAAALDMFIDITDDTVQLVMRHMEGQTTDADRLALERACAEVIAR